MGTIHQNGYNSVLVPMLQLVAVNLVFGVMAVAQPSPSASSTLWPEVANFRPRPHAGHVVWNGSLTLQPQATNDQRIEELAALAGEKARQNGNPESLVTQIVANTRINLRNDRSGWTQHSTLSFTWNNSKVLADCARVIGGVLDGKSTSPAGTLSQRFIEFYDGRNFLTFSGVGTDYPKECRLIRTSEPQFVNTLRRFGDEIFLAQGAPSRFFPPERSQMSLGEGDTIVLTRKLADPNATPPAFVSSPLLQAGNPTDTDVTLTLARNPLRPIKFVASQGRIPIATYQASDFQTFSDGVVLPQVVTITLGDGKAIGENYRLRSAAFNRNADLSSLDNPVVKGTKINDFRFGLSRGVRYVVRKRFPPDETVLRMVQQKEKDDADAQRQQQSRTVRNIALPTGALLLVGGLFWYRRTRQSKI
jgi:hypothetical protein